MNIGRDKEGGERHTLQDRKKVDINLNNVL